MLEGVVAGVISRTLSQFVEDVDGTQLSVSIGSSGHAELRDVRLRAEAVAALGLPLAMVSGACSLCLVLVSHAVRGSRLCALLVMLLWKLFAAICCSHLAREPSQTRGSVRHLTLDIPWRALGSAPVRMTLDGVDIELRVAHADASVRFRIGVSRRPLTSLELCFTFVCFFCIWLCVCVSMRLPVATPRRRSDAD